MSEQNPDSVTKIFMELHSEMARQGPGSTRSTLKALSVIPEVNKLKNILDVGCGPGMQTIDLAENTNAYIRALDFHQPYLDQLMHIAADKGLADRITPVHGLMSEMDFPEKTFDVIWAEGAIYLMGIEPALREWRKFLKNRGFIVFSDMVWQKKNPPEELKNYWLENGVEVRRPDEIIDICKNYGYKMIFHFTLPEGDWTENYYKPLKRRIDIIKDKYSGDKDAQNVINEELKEIEMFQQYKDYYSYEFYVIQDI